MEKDAAKKLVQEALQGSFNKERFVYLVKNILNHVEEAPFTYKGNLIFDDFADSIKLVERIGRYKGSDEKLLDILVVHLQKETSLERARTKQRNFVAKYLKGSRGGVLKDAALVAFVAPNGDDWRLSLVKMEYKFNEKGKVEGEFTPARRFSFLVGKNENSHTAQSRLLPRLLDDETPPILQDLENAFSVERVTKEFFEKYRDLFIRLKEALDEIVKKDLKIKADFKNKEVNTVDFAKKLLGQIVFLYFLQKKGWFGVKRGKEWGSGSKRFLRELFEKKHGGYKNFFNDILEPLFYEALRLERPSDYYSHFDSRIPFLNGGLFDPINDYDWWNTDILLPDDLFSNDLKTKEGDTGNGILDIFDRYNFTVKEDEPLEKEVAVDPEMLGKVFENLLEVKNRKSKGTYYTPREIVHYMCQESLVNYLATELEGKVNKEDIETLIKYGESVVEHDSRVINEGRETRTYAFKLPPSIRKHAKLIDVKLKTIRVCDPAVGSGAFPVGMMNEIIRTRNALTPYIGKNGERSPYNFKRQAIQNCLYGVDIDPGAVEIAKLRLWLSLIVDEEEREKIQPLPNLDYKIVCGNSLLGFPYTPKGLEKIEQLKLKFFEETRPRVKEQLRGEIDEAIKKLLANTEKSLGYKVDFDFKIFFSEVFHEKKGFDVVIANPPYLQVQKMDGSEKERLRKLFITFSKSGDIYCLFYERAVQVLKSDGVLTFITSNSWLRTKYGRLLRRFLIDCTNPILLINFEDAQIFEHAIVETNVLIAKKNPWNGRLYATIVKNEIFGSWSLDEYVRQKSSVLSDLEEEGWVIADKPSSGLKKKIKNGSVPLKDFSVSINFGIKTGLNKAFIIDEIKRNELLAQEKRTLEILKPLLRGRDVRKWAFSFSKVWLINSHNGLRRRNLKRINVMKDYPAVYRHLTHFKVELTKRTDKGEHWTNLRDCAYLDEFEKEKIVWGELSDKPKFAYDDNGFCAEATLFIMTGESLKYLLAILNSRVSEWYFNKISTSSGMGTNRWKKYKIEQLPIKRASTEEQESIVHLVDKILALSKDDDYFERPAKQAKVHDYGKQIDQLVYKLYDLAPEDVKIVENSS